MFFFFPKVNTIEFELSELNGIKNVLAVHTESYLHPAVPLKYIPSDAQGSLTPEAHNLPHFCFFQFESFNSGQ